MKIQQVIGLLMIGSWGTACSDGQIRVPERILPSIMTNEHLPSTSTDTIYYLALGDSYTIGQSVGYDERYPVQLAKRLREADFAVAEPKIIAQTGWTTTQLKNAIQQASLRPKYDLVSLLIGVNNQYQNKPVSLYVQEFRELLETSIQLAGNDTSRVFVISIPDYAYTPFGQRQNPARITQEIDQYNAINLNISKEYNINYFNIAPISREGLAHPELIASDQLHPSGKMYERWVALFSDAIIAKLNQ